MHIFSFCIFYRFWQHKKSIYPIKMSDRHRTSCSFIEKFSISFHFSGSWSGSLFSRSAIRSGSWERENEKEKRRPATLFTDYNFCVVKAKPDLIRKPNMMATLTSTLTCLEQFGHRLMAEEKSLIVVDIKLVKISKQAKHGSPPAIHEKNATSRSQSISLAFPFR